MGYLDAFEKEKSLIGTLGRDKAYTAWVMALYLEEADVDALAATALTDGPEDKKLDFIYLDYDRKRLVFTQGYFSSKKNDSAPANKAADLNTAAAWLFSGDVNSVPEQIRDIISECRKALGSDEIDAIELFYVHNLPESINVSSELQTAQEHLKKTLGSASITIRASELGISRVQHLHDAQDSHIAVKDRLDFPSRFYFEEKGPKWKAHVTSVQGIWLHTLYTKYGDRLFSANYRGFLGGDRRRRVNSGIQDSAESRAADFWAFNNGITILTVGVKADKAGKISLSGISIINGAQTTGSIGSVDLTKNNITDLKVLCRVIECSDAEAIADIVRYNNTQNAITSWDQYGNDPEQKRLAAEFKEIGYTYNIKRGFMSAGDQISIDEVIQPLLAFHGRPQDAIRGKSTIFDRKPLYANAFEGKKARHVLFVLALSKALDEKRLVLKAKSIEKTLIKLEESQLDLMRQLRFKSFFIALTSRVVETLLGKACNTQTIAFSPQSAKDHTLVECAAQWAPVVDTLLALITATPDIKNFGAKVSDDEFLSTTALQINALLHAMDAASKHKVFSDLVTGL